MIDYKIREMLKVCGSSISEIAQIKNQTFQGVYCKSRRGKYTIEQLNELAEIVGCEVECCYVFRNGERLYIQKGHDIAERNEKSMKDFSEQLYDKMKVEQEQYRDWLLSRPPAEILNHTYEYTMREDIVMAMEDMELTPKQAKALLKSPCPLADSFEVFRDRESDHMDNIRDSVESMANRIVREDFKKSQRESR